MQTVQSSSSGSAKTAGRPADISSRVRKHFVRWSQERSDIRSEIAQRGNDITIKARRIVRTIGKANAKLNELQELELRHFVTKMAQQFNISVEPSDAPDAWTAYRLRLQ